MSMSLAVLPSADVILPGVAVAAPFVNAMTVDVEDYFQVSAFDAVVPRSSWESRESRVCGNTERLLDLFADVEHQVDVLRARVGRGAVSHTRSPDCRRGARARLARLRAPSRVLADQPRSSATICEARAFALEQAGGCPVLGYRAPSYSIVRESLWALDVLIEEGYVYDSSIYPIRHDRYGIPGWPARCTASSAPADRSGSCRDQRCAWPAPTCRSAAGAISGCCRMRWTRHGIRRLNAAQQPAIFYLHPWEIDPDQPRIAAGRLSYLPALPESGARPSLVCAAC